MMKNYIKHLLFIAIGLFIILGFTSKIQAQASLCVSGCNDNTFVWSEDPNTIEYDNMVSGFHSTILREADGTVKIWGQGASPTSANVTRPLVVSPANGYTYEGEILKFTLASKSGTGAIDQQFAVLTTQGIYIWGAIDMLVSSNVKPTTTFGKINQLLGANTYGLPNGVLPTDVKMLFGSYLTLGIVTCNGEAWMLSARAGKSGQGNNLDKDSVWTQVQIASNTPLTEVVVMRGTFDAMMALTRKGEVYTWGTGTYLGNNTALSNYNKYATKMTLPSGVTPKMIGMTYNRYITTNGNSYYLLGTNGDLYALGNNSAKQLGDFTTTERNSWIRVKSRNSTTNMPKVIWISPNEHDYTGNAAVNALTTEGKLWSWGSNSGQMIGGGSSNTGATDPIFMGRGLGPEDRLIAVETGGHTTMVVRECSMKYGYIGHKVNGSMGDGTTASSNVSTFDFSRTGEVNLCGAPTAPIVQGILKMCSGSTVDLEDARIEGVALDKNFNWFTDVKGTIPVANPSSVGAGIYYVAYAENTCPVVPTTRVEVKYLEKGDAGFKECSLADLYTDIDFSIDGVGSATTANLGARVVFRVTAGNTGPKDVAGAVFTFTVPVGVDITNPDAIAFTTSCVNGSVSESLAITYNAATRTFRSQLNLPDACSITYTFTGGLSGVMGTKTVESTILRPDGIYDPDASNREGAAPINPHFECYNHDISLGGSSSALSCNNIQQRTFRLLDPCVEDLLYFEDFGSILSEENSGRLAWSGKKSLSPIQGGGFSSTRNGAIGGATSAYLFAPGQHDSRYAAANGSPHSNTVSVARIKSGYYSVNPPGFVQIGIPKTDLWHKGIWVPSAPSNDPTLPNSNYDWTPAWNHETAIRDATAAINSSAFHIRGVASASQSIKPFYEFDLPAQIQMGETYTLSMYSYVTYHDRDYMLMDVVDKDTGFVYASIPLVYSGIGIPPNASPEGFSLGWVPLQASFIFDATGCDSNIESKNIKIAIRGSQDRALASAKGFGHTLIDDISFVKRKSAGLCSVGVSKITCEEALCFIEVLGEGYTWSYPSTGSGGTLQETFRQPATNGGFVMDIYYLDNSFNMLINGVPIYEKELEFEKGIPGSPQNVRFKSDGKKWQDEGSGIQDIWKMNRGVAIDFKDIHSNPTPALRVRIDKWGNVSLYGIRAQNAVLEELEVFDPATNQVMHLDMVHWITESTDPKANKVVVTQNIAGASAMTVYGYGQNEKDCKTCTLEKEGVFNDENQDGFAHVGETITYSFVVKNAGDMDIHDLEIVDPLFGFVIKLDKNTHLPSQEGVTLSGDTNNNGILNRSETWTFTVQYKVSSEDIFTNKGVYNRAQVKGMGRLPNNSTPIHTISEESTDPTPYKEGDIGWDPTRPYHTYVPLKGGGLLISNPMIYQKTKNIH